MKKFATTLTLFLFAFVALFAQESAEVSTEGGAEMTFESEVIDYGTIPQNADGVRTFKFTNTGNEPLIISNAKGSCGCTVPTWPKKPINPGESAEIKVKYATNRLGPINKSVTVVSNAKEKTKVLRIKGNVIEKETTPVKEKTDMAPTAN
tara:strand:- start:437 stop:886 length:450 start_codon:yes stop_codon:yes gene_type:complete